MKQLRKKGWIWFLLILFTGYYSSITLFTHTHTVNGVTITHSHPCIPISGKDNSGHQHSPQQYEVIEHLSFFFSTLAVLFIITTLLVPIKRTFPRRISGIRLSSGGYCTFLLRAPPFSCLT